MNFIVLFIIGSIANVTIQTFKSIYTVKGGKVSAALWNGVAYGLYTYIIILTAGDGISTFLKMVITAVANLVCVYIVKLIEEKMRKDKLWLVKVTIPNIDAENAATALTSENISHSVITIDGYKVFDCYCNTQAETRTVTGIAKTYGGKMFATENRLF